MYSNDRENVPSSDTLKYPLLNGRPLPVYFAPVLYLRHSEISTAERQASASLFRHCSVPQTLVFHERQLRKNNKKIFSLEKILILFPRISRSVVFHFHRNKAANRQSQSAAGSWSLGIKLRVYGPVTLIHST